MLLPSVLFVTAHDSDPADIIKLVLDASELPECTIVSENCNAYKWHIDNKYFSSDVHLCALKEKCISDQEFSDSVQAIVIDFDSKNVDGLSSVESWLPFLTIHNPEIKILVCDYCGEDSGVTKRTALEWCVRRGFELVEINPDQSDIDPDDDFPETVGVERIRQALNAHSWPNLVLKNSTNQFGSINGIRRLVEQVCGDEEDEDFGELLSHLNQMKSEVSGLTGNDRKVAAEQVVMAFWRAINGDRIDNELDDGELSDVSN